MVAEDALSPATGVITLTTDFGLSDAYVGVMKGVILARASAASIVDLSHAVAPGAILEAASLLETAWRYFPPGTVHLVVVDPGVGTSRQRLAIAAAGQIFVGPDNGCLSPALAAAARGRRPAGEPYAPRTVGVPADVTAVSLANEALLGATISATFEGRDVFAPAAVYLSRGGSIGELGPSLPAIEAFPELRAPLNAQGGRDGRVLHVDRFGNLITDIHAADLPPSPVFTLGGRTIRGLSRTYGDARDLTAIVGSAGLVEVALPNGSSAAMLDLAAGASVRLI